MGPTRRSSVVALLVAVLLSAAFSAPSAISATRPNVVLMLTDDQRWDTMVAMPQTTALLGSRGVTFTQAYVTTPLCCPIRASILAGGYLAQHTGVLSNHWPNGSLLAFHASASLNLSLQRAGYRTGIIGIKLMNGDRLVSPSIVPGWSAYEVFNTDPIDRGPAAPSTWNRFWTTYGSSGERPGIVKQTRLRRYVTEYEAERAVHFITTTPPAQPLFLYVPFTAPHEPATVAPQDEGLFPGFTYTGRGWGEADMSDKPYWIRWLAEAVYVPAFAELPGRQLRTLAAVDRAVGQIVAALAASGRLDNTVIVFAADHGVHWGEHAPVGRKGLWGKGYPYEENLRVPLIMVMPKGRRGAVHHGMLAANLEIPATIIAATGIVHQGQGIDLTPLIQNGVNIKRDTLIYQHWTDTDKPRLPGLRGWAAIRWGKWKYVLHDTDEEELYHLGDDPYELESQHARSDLAPLIDDLRSRLESRMGVTMTTVLLPDGSAGLPYAVQLTGRGGSPPYYWYDERPLPPGLKINTVTGHLAGTPTEAGTYAVAVRIKDSGIRKHAGGPQQFVREFALVVR